MTRDRAPLDLSGKGVLITGGCGALGAAVIRRLDDCGAQIVANDIIDPAVARSLLPSVVHYEQSSCSSAIDAQDLIQKVVGHLGALPDVVCCHAGVVGTHPVVDYPADEMDALYITNVRAGVLLAQAAAKAWRAGNQAGQIIFTSSWVADVPWPGIAAYSASKATVNAYVRSFARELAPFGIRANAIAPGIVGAGMAQHQWDTDAEYRARAQKAIPLGRLQAPESVADAFAFLISDLSTYMTGSILTVDGGASLYPLD